MKKQMAYVLATVTCMALAQENKVLEPVQSRQPLVPNPYYFYQGKGGLQLLQFNAWPFLLVRGDVAGIHLTYESSNDASAKTLRLVPSAGGPSININLLNKNTFGEESNELLPISRKRYDIGFSINTNDLTQGTNDSATYKASLIDSNNQEGESMVISFNFRNLEDFHQEKAFAKIRQRDQEHQQQSIGINYSFEFGPGALLLFGLDQFESFARMHYEMRLPPGFPLEANMQLVQILLHRRVVTATDDTGQQYVLSMDYGHEPARPTSPNSFMFNSILEPKLNDKATRLSITFPATPTVRLNGQNLDLSEPFKSGFVVVVPIKR